MTTTANDSIMALPAEVQGLFEEFRRMLAGHGEIRWNPPYTRISVWGRKAPGGKSQRYMKYEPKGKRWVFCSPIGDRMNTIDSEGICDPRKDGIRSGKAVGEYRGVDPSKVSPLLKRLADIIRQDEG
jgi:hypothetical protein